MLQGTHLCRKDQWKCHLARGCKKAIKQADAIVNAVGSKKKKGTSLFSYMARSFMKAATNLRFTDAVPLITGFSIKDSRKYLIFSIQTVISPFLKDQ